ICRSCTWFLPDGEAQGAGTAKKNRAEAKPLPECDYCPHGLKSPALQVRQVDFHGDVITVVLVEEHGRRQVYVLLRPLCQYLRLSWSSQLQRLREDDVLSEATTSVLLSNTLVGHRQRYKMIGLQLEFLPGWMFSFTPK